jgi:hypothetical protein
MGFASIQDIRVRVFMCTGDMDEWLVVTCFEFVDNMPEHRRFIHCDWTLCTPVI